MKVYAELLLYVFKFIFLIMNIFKKKDLEENKLFMERMQAATNLLKNAIEGKAEAIDEKTYLSNIEWEEKKRYETYKKKLLYLLKEGFGYEMIKNCKVMGMGERAYERKDEVVMALQKVLSVQEKSKLIAKILAV